ncbi:MAG: DegT/DnrJ/EryC1/StrS family aminotransferase [Xanthomonadales bacterium]|nr:DegT/DnrJ/EryC1/StrS family aminotransferase [Xanthomonadales bacterium]
MRIPLARPDITRTEVDAVLKVLSQDVLSRGPVLQRFEQCVARRLGVGHAVGLSSGTAALHLSMVAVGVEPGDEVITVPFTVPATVNAILASGARPVLVDVEAQTRGMDPERLEQAITPATRAVVVVHAFGQPAAMARIERICRSRDLVLVEDACEGLGSSHQGRALGSIGRTGCFGFYPNKQITTGEGGILVTSDSDLAERVRRLANHGRSMDGAWLDQQEVGWNYRMSEVQAALGVSQMQRLDGILEARRQVAAWYAELWPESVPLKLPAYWPDPEIAWFALVAQLADPADRDGLIACLADRGIQCGRYFAPMHRQPAMARFGWKHDDFPVCNQLADSALALPFFTTMTRAQVAEVCRALADWRAANPV